MSLERISEQLRRVLMCLAGAALLGITLLATANVALRIFRVPVGGAYEIVSFLGALVTAGALGYTQKHRHHIVVDILSDRYPPALKRAVDRVSHAAMFLLFAAVAWQTARYGMRLIRVGELSETLKVPFHPFVFLVALGFAVLALTILLDLLESFWAGEGKR